MDQVTTADVDRTYGEVIAALKAYVDVVEACTALARASWTPEEKFVTPGADLLERFHNTRKQVLKHCRIAEAALKPMRGVLHETSQGAVTVRRSSAPSLAEAVTKSLPRDLVPPDDLDLGRRAHQVRHSLPAVV